LGEGVTMVTFSRTNIRIAELLKLYKQKELILQPKFQRRSCWEEKARSYLIDTIVKGYPMPKIFLRKIVSPKTNLMAYEVVDGQQRLQAIIDYHNDNLVLSKHHNLDFGNSKYSELPDSVQKNFLQYQLSTEILEDASDPEVWEMFERLNSYTLTLNKQEKRNAEFFGYFKQTAYSLASEQTALDAWRNLRVFSNRQIARMSEVELASDVLVAILDGISDLEMITKAYDKYDDVFQSRDIAERKFRNTLSYINSEISEVVRKTRFRNRSWFYSLMVAVADTIEGINGGIGPGTLQPAFEIQKRMYELNDVLVPELMPRGLIALAEALSKTTSHIPARQIRHEHFYALLNLPEEQWIERWKSLGNPLYQSTLNTGT
jgi:uncharacterized protein with ParB-like and HNH nuclease domain